MGQLEDMEAFVRVVEAGGIGNAAEQMGIAKSAVSRRLSELESRLGVTLINRTTRTQKLSDTGEHYYKRALQIINEMSELNNVTANPDCDLNGTIRISAPLAFGLSHLTPALDSFFKTHPKLSLDVDFTDNHIDLIAGGYDLAFRIGDLDDSSLKARLMFPVSFTLCASPQYLAENGTPETPEQLKHHQILRYSLANSTSMTLIDKENQKHTIATKGRIIANNGSFLSDMAVAGHGITLIPTFISWQSLALGELVPVMQDYTLLELNAYAVYPQARHLSRRTRLLIDFLVERFGNNPYWDQN